MLRWLWGKLCSLYNKFLGISEEPLNHKDMLIEHGALYDWWRRISYLAFTFRTPATRKLDHAIRKFSDTIVFEDHLPIQTLQNKINLWKLLRNGKSQRFAAVEQFEDELNERMKIKSVDDQLKYCQYGHFFQKEKESPVDKLQAAVKHSVESARRLTAGSAMGFLLQFIDFDYSFIMESLAFAC